MAIPQDALYVMATIDVLLLPGLISLADGFLTDMGKEVLVGSRLGEAVIECLSRAMLISKCLPNLNSG